LVANTYLNYLLDRDMRMQEFKALRRVATGVPIRRVRPPSDASKIFALADAIALDARTLPKAWTLTAGGQ